jgi:polyprenyldihydroxybenzoate methyltransferase/3-demethylubiquinol 3-O-methyltransferase
MHPPRIRVGQLVSYGFTGTVRHTFGLSAVRISRRAQSTSSINPVEIGHFDKLAATWWDPHGSSRLLHLMNPLRHKFIRDCLQEDAVVGDRQGIPSKIKYLDVGCGGGIFSESAARLPTTASVLGLDASENVIEIARKHAQTDPSIMLSGKLTYKQGGIESLPIPASDNERVDILTVFEVLEHVNQPSAFLEACMPHVKPGGWLIMSTISRSLASWFTTKFMAEDVLRIVPRGTHDWNKYILPQELESWFSKQPGWGFQRTLGVIYVPGVGWREVPRSEELGNYFFGVRRLT